ncbi:MAG: peptidoglycan-binding protein [Oscillospiraceae bacterium]|nr:peptidoglycan-binding protein [Oscillospiraceae bacterium]
MDFKLLKRGARGPQTELLQLALRREGALKEAPDGVFGARTEAALKDYQRRWGLAADGIAGPASWAALRPWLTGYRRVTLRPGDTLYRLAERYGVSLSAVETANPGVDPRNLQPGGTVTVPLPFEVVPDSVRFTSAALALCAEGLKARYPFLTEESAGSSVLERPLRLFRFGEGPRSVFFNGAHHANEWITSPLLLRFLERLSAAFAENGAIAGAKAQELWSRSALRLLPMVDPDGVDLVTGELGPGDPAYARALELNGAAPGFPENWKANIRGVDLNLQYPAGWEEARRIKFAQGYTRPGPRDYVGLAPLTEPESRAVYELSLANAFALTLSYHTQGKVIYWKYNGYEPAGSEAIGRKMAALSGYSLELTPPESAWAGYKDWFIQQFDRPGYTVEAGQGTAPLPLSQLEEIYRANEPLLVYAMTAE